MEIEIVIKIPDDRYKILTNPYQYNEALCDELKTIVRKGTPLSKGHGDLIDRDKIEYLKAIHDAIYRHISWSDAIKKIKYSAPTIIEADREEQE